MTVLFADNLAMLADAPAGIPKLRQLILQLAVRGTLVPQLATEDGARLLLTLLTAASPEQAEGQARRKKMAVLDTDVETPYVIPPGWEWCRLNELVKVLNGRAYKKDELLESGTPVLRVGNLFTSKHWYYSNITLDADKYCHAGDLIFAWSASFGPFIWLGERVIYHYHIWKLHPHDQRAISKRYLHLFLQERTQAIKAAGHGVSMAHMTKEKMEVLPVALPPLAEQHRIVAKVDELMAHCDRLEARQQDAEAAHTQLVQVLLDSLTQARDAEEFRASWERVAAQFDVLFTTEESVAALASALLELGITGRFATHDATDDPAASLMAKLERDGIQYRARVAAPQRAVHEVLASDIAIALPTGWEWVRLGSIFRVITDGDHQAPPQTAEGVAFLTIGNVSDGYLNFSNCRFVDRDYFQQLARYRKPSIGDVLYTVVGATYGRPVLVETDRPFCVQRHIAILKRSVLLHDRFALYLLQSPLAYRQAAASTTGTAQPTVPLKPLRNFVVPLPPLPEQRRIADKLDELLALCDRLKAHIGVARAKHALLADGLVAQAVAI